MSFCLFLLVYLQFLTITLSKITLPGVKKDIFETDFLQQKSVPLIKILICFVQNQFL